jgi:hypothetical protein
MNKNLIVVFSFVLVLFLGFGAYFFISKNKSTPGQTSETTGTSETAEVSPAKSLRELLSSGISQSCDFTDAASGSTGKFYFGGGKMRGDFVSKVNNVEYGVHTYSDGQDVYMWTDGQSQGFKMSATAQISPSGTPAPNQQVDLDRQVDYNCVNWSADQSKFELPNGIEFKDFSAMLAVPTGEDNSAKCAACNELPADAKTQCLQILGC